MSNIEIKNALKQYWNGWLLFYIVGLVLSATLLNFRLSVTTNIVSFIVMIVVQLLYSINSKQELFFKIIHWCLFILFVLLGTIFIAASVNELNIAVFILLATVGLILASGVVVNFISLWKSKDQKKNKLITLLIRYSLLVILTILLFGFLFSITNGFDGDRIRKISDDSKLNFEEILYFSAFLFYSNTFGDIIPTGFSRFLTVFELAVSFILHIIILGFIISTLTNSKKQ